MEKTPQEVEEENQQQLQEQNKEKEEKMSTHRSGSPDLASVEVGSFGDDHERDDAQLSTGGGGSSYRGGSGNNNNNNDDMIAPTMVSPIGGNYHHHHHHRSASNNSNVIVRTSPGSNNSGGSNSQDTTDNDSNITNYPPSATAAATAAAGGGGNRTTLHHHHHRDDSEPSQVFGPNKSALSMLKQLRFSPFATTNIKGNNSSVADGGNGSGGGVVGNNSFSNNPNRLATSAWEFFTPRMAQIYQIVTYIIAIQFVSCGIAALVARYQSKPNSPIECDYRLDQALSWLAGLQLPAAVSIVVWMAIFLQHVYPPLYQASKVPLERTFKFYNAFVLYSTFCGFLLIGIFGSSLYALSVAHKWDYAEHKACGSAFTTVRGVSIAAVCSIGFLGVGHFVHWAYLTSKLDEQRGIVRPIPAEN